MIQIKKKELEMMRVSLARQEIEIKIEELKEEIKRLSDHIEIQVKKEAELKVEIEKMRKQ